MSYAFQGVGASLGETESWLGVWAGADEVFLLRFRARGLKIRSPLDLLTFVRAVGESGTFQVKFDVRGVAVSGAEDDRTVDVIFTSHFTGSPSIVVPTASGILSDVKNDPDVQKTFSGLELSDPLLLELSGPPDAVDHWRSQPILWDQKLSGPKGHGGPTDSFANPPEYSIVLGKADDGKRAKPWPVEKPGLGPNGSKDKGESSTLLLVVGIGAVGALGWFLGQGKKGKRRP